MEGVGTDGGVLAVFDPLGCLVMQQIVDAEQNAAVLDLECAGLPSGLYQVRLRAEGGAVSKPLVFNRL